MSVSYICNILADTAGELAWLCMYNIHVYFGLQLIWFFELFTYNMITSWL